MTDVVYHASPRSHLRVIMPSISTHGQSYVYACLDPDMAAVFLSRYGGDLTCQVLRCQGLPCIVERYQGAWEERYKGRTGSLYSLPAGTFTSSVTTWREEVVSTEQVPVYEETHVPDVEVFLLDLAGHRRLWIARFPELVPCLPANEFDYVETIADWIRAGKTLEVMAREVLDTHRPDLRKQVESVLGSRL